MQAEQTAIRETVLAVAGTGSRVRLFGSRVDNHARGGDIDLLFAAPNLHEQAIHRVARETGIEL